jgi:hypothetical protein
MLANELGTFILAHNDLVLDSRVLIQIIPEVLILLDVFELA